jgi:hypothetical protein
VGDDKVHNTRTVLEPVRLLSRNAAQGEDARLSLLLELLAQSIHDLDEPLAALLVEWNLRADRWHVGAFCGIDLRILVLGEGTQPLAFFFVARSRWREVVCRHLPEGEIEARSTRQGQHDDQALGNENTHPMISHASGAIFLTSSNSAKRSGIHGF